MGQAGARLHAEAAHCAQSRPQTQSRLYMECLLIYRTAASASSACPPRPTLLARADIRFATHYTSNLQSPSWAQPARHSYGPCRLSDPWRSLASSCPCAATSRSELPYSKIRCTSLTGSIPSLLLICHWTSSGPLITLSSANIRWRRHATPPRHKRTSHHRGK